MTRLSTDAHTTAAEAFVSRANERFDDADHGAVDDALHDLAYDVMLAYGPVVELHVLTESAFEAVRNENPFVRRAVSEGRSYV